MKKEILHLPEHFAIHATALVNHVHTRPWGHLKSVYDGWNRPKETVPLRVEERIETRSHVVKP